MNVALVHLWGCIGQSAVITPTYLKRIVERLRWQKGLWSERLCLTFGSVSIPVVAG
jgi:hypothetical protein